MPISRNEASRFLAQASLGATASEIASVQQLGYAGWLEQQFALAPTESRVAWLRRKGFDAIDNQQSDRGFDASSWRKLLSSPDTLRQRVALALSEILVVGIDGLDAGKWPAFTGAAYQDLLEANAFGNYRTLLERVTTSPAMGEYLTYRGNSKANPISGAQPDENYARELMQLFTIGLIKLSPDGSPALVNGATQPTYSQSDILGLLGFGPAGPTISPTATAIRRTTRSGLCDKTKAITNTAPRPSWASPFRKAPTACRACAWL